MTPLERDLEGLLIEMQNILDTDAPTDPAELLRTPDKEEQIKRLVLAVRIAVEQTRQSRKVHRVAWSE